MRLGSRSTKDEYTIVLPFTKLLSNNVSVTGWNDCPTSIIVMLETDTGTRSLFAPKPVTPQRLKEIPLSFTMFPGHVKSNRSRNVYEAGVHAHIVVPI